MFFLFILASIPVTSLIALHKINNNVRVFQYLQQTYTVYKNFLINKLFDNNKTESASGMNFSYKIYHWWIIKYY